MLLEDAIQARRSVKHYHQDQKIPEADFHKIIQAGMLAPTSFNIQHWRFVRVSSASIREQIRQHAFDQAQVTEAAELVIITADVQAWRKQPERYWVNADSETRNFLVGMIHEFYNGRSVVQADEAMRSGSLAAQNMMLQAKALGYDSCPMIGFDADVVAELIRLPEDHLIVMMLTIGSAKADAQPRGGQLPIEQVLIDNQF